MPARGAAGWHRLAVRADAVHVRIGAVLAACVPGSTASVETVTAAWKEENLLQ